jgi:hypothetical protein
MQKGIVFVFATYLDKSYYGITLWVSLRKRNGRDGFVPACIHILNSLKFRLLHKNHPRE